jgi:hypothetical protein
MTEETKETTTDATTEHSNPKLKSGFAVLISEDGSVYVERNPQVLTLPIERESTLIEVRRYCSEILMDIQAQSAAEYTVIRLSQTQTPKE